MSVELPDSYQAIYQRAIQQMGVGESQEAIDSLLRIVKRLSRLRLETLQRKPNLQQTLNASWSAVVDFLSWEQRYQEAIDLTTDVMDRLPDPREGPIRIASLTVESGQVEEGLAALTQIAHEQDDFAAWASLGSEFRILERYDEALDAYQAALRRATSNEEAVLANLALYSVYRSTDRIADALDAWQMVLVLEPEMADQEHQIYSWLIRDGLFSKAAPYLEREPFPLRRTFFEGLVDWHANRQEAARRKWQEVIDMDVEPDADVDIEAFMEAALRLGTPKVADEVGQTLFLSGEMISVRAQVLRGIAKLMLDQPGLAQTHFEQALFRFRRSSRIRSGLAADQWELLTTLVPDSERTANMAQFFDTGS
jgi:tetratricopeptide (TPR) repeat protein